jgi:hypothetical protein
MELHQLQRKPLVVLVTVPVSPPMQLCWKRLLRLWPLCPDLYQNSLQSEFALALVTFDHVHIWFVGIHSSHVIRRS